MRALGFALAMALALVACGQGAQRPDGGGAAQAGACPLLGDAAAMFGDGADLVGGGQLDAIDATCTITSANGARSGDFLTYTSASLGAVTLEARMAEIAQSWDAMTDTPLAAVPELGEGAQIATDLPGYQTQIVFRKGDTLVLVNGRSGDDAMSGEQVARRMAAAIYASIEAP